MFAKYQFICSFYPFQEREVDLLAKEFELAKERQAEFLGDRYCTCTCTFKFIFCPERCS